MWDEIEQQNTSPVGKNGAYTARTWAAYRQSR